MRRCIRCAWRGESGGGYQEIEEEERGEVRIGGGCQRKRNWRGESGGGCQRKRNLEK